MLLKYNYLIIIIKIENKIKKEKDISILLFFVLAKTSHEHAISHNWLQHRLRIRIYYHIAITSTEENILRPATSIVISNCATIIKFVDFIAIINILIYNWRILLRRRSTGFNGGFLLYSTHHHKWQHKFHYKDY